MKGHSCSAPRLPAVLESRLGPPAAASPRRRPADLPIGRLRMAHAAGMGLPRPQVAASRATRPRWDQADRPNPGRRADGRVDG